MGGDRDLAHGPGIVRVLRRPGALPTARARSRARGRTGPPRGPPREARRSRARRAGCRTRSGGCARRRAGCGRHSEHDEAWLAGTPMQTRMRNGEMSGIRAISTREGCLLRVIAQEEPANCGSDPVPLGGLVTIDDGSPKEDPMADAFSSGTLAGAGSFRCDGCGFALALQERDQLPECPECGGDRFRRALLFEPEGRPAAHHDTEGTPGWLGAARERIDTAGDYLAYAGRNGRRWWRSSPAGRGWAAACRPTCASTTRRSHAGTRSSTGSRAPARASSTTGA